MRTTEAWLLLESVHQRAYNPERHLGATVSPLTVAAIAEL